MSNQPLPAVQAADQLDFISHSPAQTERVGVRLGEQLATGDLVLLVGTFGVGKTCLVRGIARGLGSTNMVTSPSFVLINEYQAGSLHQHIPIYHIDLYRLGTEAEVATIGIEELWNGEGICLVEWPERAQTLMPTTHLSIYLQHLSETKRQLRFVPHGPRAVTLLHTFHQLTFN